MVFIYFCGNQDYQHLICVVNITNYIRSSVFKLDDFMGNHFNLLSTCEAQIPGHLRNLVSVLDARNPSI